MRFPLWLPIVLGLLWAYFSFNKIYCEWCGCCGTAAVVPATTDAAGPLTYNWGDGAALKGEGFDAYKTSTLAGGAMADTLVITGQYRADETYTSTEFANLGLARAAAAKTLFLDKVPESRIRLASELVTDGMAKGGRFASAGFTWIKGIINEGATTIIESGNSTTILFPFGSSIRDQNKEVDAFLATLCSKYKDQEKTTFSIVGHTDNVGDDERNKQLGLNRAMGVREVLRSCGVDRNRIQAESMGEAAPAADNETQAGRHQNRRVVITVNQSN